MPYLGLTCDYSGCSLGGLTHMVQSLLHGRMVVGLEAVAIHARDGTQQQALYHTTPFHCLLIEAHRLNLRQRSL